MDLNQGTYRPVNASMLRSCLLSRTTAPQWPQLTGTESQQAACWRTWMNEVLHRPEISQAVRHASPDLATRIDTIIGGHTIKPDKVIAAGLSLTRYVARMYGRATPFGTMAGVSPARFGPRAGARLGQHHRVVARAGAGWVSEVINILEGFPALRPRLTVVANDTIFVRGDRFVVPFQPLRPRDRTSGSIEMSLRQTSAVVLALELAHGPIRWDELTAKISAEFTTATVQQIDGLLRQLLQTSALVSNLHAPSTTVDALQHLVDVLAATGACNLAEVAPLFRELQGIQRRLTAHNQFDLSASGSARQSLTSKMTRLRDIPRPLAIDTWADAEVVVPPAVLREAAAAAGLLTQLSPSPFGPLAWQHYAQTFFERYGIGALVPVLDLVDPDAGLGLPDGYLTAAPEPPRAVTDRDLRLLALAQTAALDHVAEVELTPELINELALPGLDRAVPPRHLELTYELHAPSTAAIDVGRFDLTVVSVSRGIGTVTGRFLPLLGSSCQAEHAKALSIDAEGNHSDVLRVQLSAPPLAAADAHVSRTPHVLPDLITIAEHHRTTAGRIPISDLAVATDGYHLHLASISRGRWLEPVLLNAIDLRAHSLALVRFLSEVTRAQSAVVTSFDWGAAARLPYLPRLRHHRTIISPATWRITATDLPDTDLHKWTARLAELRAQRRIPAKVLTTRGDQRLPLDLEQISHAAVLRADLARHQIVTLTEQPSPGAFGWLDGHAHELVSPLVATTPPRRTTPPAPSREQVLGFEYGHLPGTSRWMTVKLYGHPARQDEILTGHLPQLLPELPPRSDWWFIRYRDPQPHLRLRIHLDTPADFGPAAAAVSAWADSLRRQRLLHELLIAPYYPEPGRWGHGAALAAAEQIFAADSQTLLVQLGRSDGPARQAVTAVNFVAIATAFTGSTGAAMRWLTEHARIDLDQAPPRDVLTTAVRIADPTNDWVALRRTETGFALVDSWVARDQALRAYRAEADHAGLDVDELLLSLLHVHHIRAVGIDRTDEALCLRLARAAALTWTARRKDQR